ncbi:MAG: hypothetical protein M5U28_44530 [Sandaracinaceae bacterium]|nr:hypothetical protein [Sandaracinaceae bacterium]
MRTMRWTVAALALVAGCGGAQSEPVDEEALRAQIRAEVLAELRDNRRVAEERAAERPSEPPEPLPGDDAERVRVEPGDGPRRGASEPLVVIVMFSEFQCPFCARSSPRSIACSRSTGARCRSSGATTPCPSTSRPCRPPRRPWRPSSRAATRSSGASTRSSSRTSRR